MAPKRKAPTVAPKGKDVPAESLPPKRTRKAPALDDYHVEKVMVVSKPITPAKKAELEAKAALAASSPKVSKSKSSVSPKVAAAVSSPPAAAAAPSKSKSRRGTSLPASATAVSPSSSSSSSSKAGSIDISALWNQVWKALSITIACTVIVFVGNVLFDTVVKGNKISKAPATLAVELGRILAIVAGAVAIPFVAVSGIAVSINVYKSGTTVQKVAVLSILAALVAVSSQIVLQLRGGK